MQKFLSNFQMRSADEYTIKTLGVPSLELMERAGTAIADHVGEVVKALSRSSKICVVCGGGNNGGDGYVCARVLMERGYSVKVYDISDGIYSPDCTHMRSLYGGAYARKISGGVIVDCIFGTGLSRSVEGKYAEAIEKINGSNALVVSADIPSGLNGDNGKAMGVAVSANMTVAIAQYKLGHVLGDGPDYCGATVKADIGIAAPEDAAVALEDEEIATFYPQRPRNSHKGTYGSACIVAGNAKYPGAAALSLSTALRSGCGYVKLVAEEGVKNSLVAAYPQVIYLSAPDLSSSAIAVGPGCGKSRELYDLLCNLLKNYSGNLIIDADGLNVLSEYGTEILKGAKCKVLITPHAKEFSRLTKLSVEQILIDPVKHAKEFAKSYGVNVLLKGAATVITDGQRTFLNLRGSTALAKGGSGDMLTGLICGTAARGVELIYAAVCASYTLGCAAERVSAEFTDYCATAEEIVAELPKIIKNFMND